MKTENIDNKCINVWMENDAMLELTENEII